jgi:hypothetical protein
LAFNWWEAWAYAEKLSPHRGPAPGQAPVLFRHLLIVFLGIFGIVAFTLTKRNKEMAVGFMWWRGC